MKNGTMYRSILVKKNQRSSNITWRINMYNDLETTRIMLSRSSSSERDKGGLTITRSQPYDVLARL